MTRATVQRKDTYPPAAGCPSPFPEEAAMPRALARDLTLALLCGFAVGAAAGLGFGLVTMGRA